MPKASVPRETLTFFRRSSQTVVASSNFVLPSKIGAVLGSILPDQMHFLSYDTHCFPPSISAIYTIDRHSRGENF
jgi:hypothetical protein